MGAVTAPGARILGIATCVPSRRFDNVEDTTEFPKEDVRKVVGMAGVSARRTADESTCSSDLCTAAARVLFDELGTDPATIDAAILVTQTPDYPMPSTACLVQERLGLPEDCAAFDVGLGCSGYPYALWIASALLSSGGARRVLILHGETPTRYANPEDRATALLFGDAGSATLLERGEPTDRPWAFVLRSDGSGSRDLIIEGGGFRVRRPDDPGQCFVSMNGANVFNFTIRVLPPLVRDTLEVARRPAEEVDYWVFHQSNLFILKHLMKKIGLDAGRVPLILKEFGNAGGPSVPLTITQGGLERPADRPLSLMLLGYGVGLSWASALVDLPPDAVLCHTEWSSES